MLSYYGEYSKTCVKQPLSKRPKNGIQDRLLLNAGQKCCRMLPLEHSAILSTFMKLPAVINTFILSIFEWQFYKGFTVCVSNIFKIGPGIQEILGGYKFCTCELSHLTMTLTLELGE